MSAALLFFLRHPWLMFVAVVCINGIYSKFYWQRQIQERPELAAGYRKLMRGYLFWGSLPWIVMGIGLGFGGVPSIFSYFRPRDGNPFVLAFWFVVYAIWILGFWWIFFARGAEFLAKHQGVRRSFPRSPNEVRIFYCLSLAGGIAGTCFMWFGAIPALPK